MSAHAPAWLLGLTRRGARVSGGAAAPDGPGSAPRRPAEPVDGGAGSDHDRAGEAGAARQQRGAEPQLVRPARSRTEPGNGPPPAASMRQPALPHRSRSGCVTAWGARWPRRARRDPAFGARHVDRVRKAGSGRVRSASTAGSALGSWVPALLSEGAAPRAALPRAPVAPAEPACDVGVLASASSGSTCAAGSGGPVPIANRDRGLADLAPDPSVEPRAAPRALRRVAASAGALHRHVLQPRRGKRRTVPRCHLGDRPGRRQLEREDLLLGAAVDHASPRHHRRPCARSNSTCAASTAWGRGWHPSAVARPQAR